ncbi:baseplate J/gp47 family protein [Roseomonas xinghualingensis]|uniref:baseplate J/gp47 family protein n=1 Tax=Roseomonas xinghualingensis TaxID=2986475 RepID=UPI0021F13231|nr:baseplate J/gp47 family protein [Roseomonas sp. SXEYE001]MCV4206928.1 baseplate J/gp47 family protein [Roseomonas sp. SXEYE001]
MPYERPTLTALARQARADMSAAIGGAPLLRASPLAILSKVLAGLVHGVYGYLDWIALQSNPFTATGAFLVAWGALVGIYRKTEATAAGSVTFLGAPGSLLPEGTRLARASDGLSYRTTALGTVGADGTATVPIEADEAGAVGNALAGAEVALVGALSGVTSTGTMATAAGGADAETEEDFRARVLERYAEPPQGGSLADYVRWAKEVPGVTRAWSSSMGDGTVVVHVMLDEARAGADGFPQGSDGVAADEPRGTTATGDQLLVADHLALLRPATALVYVAAPSAQPVPVVIADLDADSAEIRAAILAALRGMLRRTAAPGGTTYQSDWTGAIKGVAGVNRFTLVEPAGSVTAATGALLTVGADNISWI